VTDIYERLANFLDELPAGYPRTDNGVEMRILRRLFTPQEAELCMHLTLIGEEADDIAHRARLPIEEASQRLEEMEKKGLIHGVHRSGKPVEYMAMHFVVGFWEGQVNKLDRELVEAFEEYLPYVIDHDLWQKAPQLRTIPVSVSIPTGTMAMPYERAEEMLDMHSTFAVVNCICRQEQRILGHDCKKPMETCLSFGMAANSAIRNNQGRSISREEAREILQLADETGLVLQSGNAKDPIFICMCCGCCCGVLRGLKLHPQPARIASSPYLAMHDPMICSGCGTCVERCQMEAMSLSNGTAELSEDRCIGCGLCVSTCTTGALRLVRKPEAEQPAVPRDIVGTNIQIIKARGKYNKSTLLRML
jgi:Na+-translocating ferredoxin:NAD+ oxidoreductase subunit B